jgi:hypothetical protein
VKVTKAELFESELNKILERLLSNEELLKKYTPDQMSHLVHRYIAPLRTVHAACVCIDDIFLQRLSRVCA